MTEVTEEVVKPKKKAVKKIKFTYTNPILQRLSDYYKGKENILAHFRLDSEEGISEVPQEFLNWYMKTFVISCTNCALCEKRTQVVPPDGRVGAEIMIVSEGPGFLEDLTGLPLVGYNQLLVSRCNFCEKTKSCFANRLLDSPTSWGKKRRVVTCDRKPTQKPTLLPKRQYIRSAGQVIDGILYKIEPSLKRQSFYNLYSKEQLSPFFITNSVLCRSTSSDRLKDEPPDSLSRKNCKFHLLVQLACVQPKLIILLGKIASQTFTAESLPQRTICESKLGFSIIKDFHPAFIMRIDGKEEKAYAYANLTETFKKALDYIKPEEETYDETSTDNDDHEAGGEDLCLKDL